MELEVIQSAQAPQAVGPYSLAIKAGRTVYLSGQLGIVPETGELHRDFEAQAHQVFRNLRMVCQAAGGNLDNIARLGIYLTDMGNFAALNRIMGEYFAAPYPARSAIQVGGLPKNGMVEADAIMVL